MHDEHDESEVVTTPAAERLLGLGPGTLPCWRSRNVPDQPPYIRIGRKAIRYRRADLIEYLERRRVFAGEAPQ